MKMFKTKIINDQRPLYCKDSYFVLRRLKQIMIPEIEKQSTSVFIDHPAPASFSRILIKLGKPYRVSRNPVTITLNGIGMISINDYPIGNPGISLSKTTSALNTLFHSKLSAQIFPVIINLLFSHGMQEDIIEKTLNTLLKLLFQDYPGNQYVFITADEEVNHAVSRIVKDSDYLAIPIREKITVPEIRSTWEVNISPMFHFGDATGVYYTAWVRAFPPDQESVNEHMSKWGGTVTTRETHK